MRILRVAFIFFLISFSKSYSQEVSNNDDYWQLLFKNQREESLEKFNKNKQDNIEDYLTTKVLNNEKGVFKVSEDFIAKVSGYQDYEYYLYALWNYHFFFNNYIEEGFNNQTVDRIKQLELNSINNSTVKEALKYLKSVVYRHENKWDDYYKLNNEIKVIKNWQYCGTFENLNGSGLDTQYEPEIKAVSDVDFNANSNGHINWYNNKNFEKEAYQFYTNHSEYGAGVNYAQTFINNPLERRVVLRVGNSSLSKVWLNDVVVLENTNNGYTDLDAYNVEITLPKGNNRLLIKSADKNGIAYFIARFTDKEGNEVKDIEYSSTYKPYEKGDVLKINPISKDNSIESFFKNKVKNSPDDFFFKFCLINTYFRNSKYKESKNILLPLIKLYPNSSFLRKLLIQCYNLEKDYSSSKELKKNIEKDDEKYYLSYFYRFKDAKELFKLPIKEFEKFIGEFEESTDISLYKFSAKLLLGIRREDKSAIKKDLKYLTTKYKDWTNIVKIYVSLYTGYLNEDEQAIEVLQNLNSDYFDYGAIRSLARMYNKQNQKEKVLKLFKRQYQNISGDNVYLKDYISYLHEYKKYEESIPYIKQVLKQFPYSFLAMEYMGKALEQTGKKKEALSYYKKSLKHNGGNSSLRKKIEDLSNTKDYFDDLATSDIYEFVSDNRNKITENNYGYNYLLDETLLQLYSEGGGRRKTTYIVEITSDSGIESLKEVDLGLSGNYSITKFEIVKQNKTIVPASKSGSNIVFNNLEIGDVIYVSYESSFTSSGRFYKDYIDYFQLDSYHPTIKNAVNILVPKGKAFTHKLINGSVPYQQKQIDDYICHSWQMDDMKTLDPQEDYMPSLSDVSKYLHISTIGSWDDIANWYSDLVRPQTVINSDVKEAFNEIFPNDFSKYSEEERAQRIYYYIMENFSYSHVGFRQSGFVPQKPSKTIKSKLGDCKDFSTLYVTLAQMAGLNSHMVLILTSDYGRNSMILPSQDFNHCIAKVFIDNKPQYLELTDNNLPYKSIPTSLEGALALDIPNKKIKDVQKGIYYLDDINHSPTSIESIIEYTLGNEEHLLKIKSVLNGSINAHYASIFKEKNYEVIKTKITEDYKGRILEDFKTDTIYNIEYDLRSPSIGYTSNLVVNEKFDEIGKMKVFRLPAVNNSYNSSIISDDKRSFPIEYILYENADIYKSSYVIKLKGNEKFVEIPENQSFNFKKHNFSIKYELIKPNELFINIVGKTSKERIDSNEYYEFKVYVKSVLDAKTQLIGYKSIN